MRTPSYISPVEFGRDLRSKYFGFDSNYVPLNHGSYGAFPIPVRDYQRKLQDSIEARSDPFIRYTIPTNLTYSREMVADYLGTQSENVVFIPNATTAINTILRNLRFVEGDVILYFSFAYPACVKTIQYICETTPARSHCINLVFPAEDDDVVDAFSHAFDHLTHKGFKSKILMFDTVVTFPGVRLPWERLVKSCRDKGVLSLVDGAHGIGHIDLRNVDEVKPDFFTSNCYKWLYTPRPCGILYIPSYNQHLIRSSIPTSHGFQPNPSDRDRVATSDTDGHETAFTELFQWVATVDQTPYLCVPEATRFRQEVCGGEDRIRAYCFNLAEQGGNLVAKRLETKVMRNSNLSINQCCFTNVLLPLTFSYPKVDDPSRGILEAERGPEIVKYMMEYCMTNLNTWIAMKYYNGAVWARLSAQIYLDLSDFEKAADILLAACSKVVEYYLGPATAKLILNTAGT